MIGLLTLPQKLIGAGMALTILVLGIMLADARGDVRHERKRADNELAARIELAEKYRGAAALAKQMATARKAAIERERIHVTKEVSHEYRTQLADLRRRFDAYRVRLAAAGTNPRPPGSGDLPGLPDASGRADAGTSGAGAHPGILISPEQAFGAESIRLQLIGLQAWVKRQEAVPE